MTPEERAALRKLAEAATKGPWRKGGTIRTSNFGARRGYVETANRVPGPNETNSRLLICDRAFREGPLREEYEANLGFIAAAHPGTVLALLDARDAAETERDASRHDRQACANDMELSVRYRDERIAALEAERDRLREALALVIASARPHPVEHPTMTVAWEVARAALAAAEPRK